MTKYINIPLSNEDIHNAVLKFDKRGANIYQDEFIKPDTDIETVFNNRGHCILFHKYPNQNIGHWYTILRDYNNNVIIFDSYGKHINYYCKNMLPMLKNNGVKNVIINRKKFQNDSSAVCGRYGLFLGASRKLNCSLNEIYKMLDEGKKKHGSYDKFILHVST